MLFCHLPIFFKINFLRKKSFRYTIKTSDSLDPNQDPNQAGRFIRPDLGPNCLPRLSSDDTGRQRVFSKMYESFLSGSGSYILFTMIIANYLLDLYTYITKRGSLVCSLSIWYECSPDLPCIQHPLSWRYFPSSADSRRASCQLLAKKLTLNTGKLPSGGMPRNSVVK